MVLFMNVDEDECVTGSDNCGSGQVCMNTEGGFTCVCAAGYIPLSTGGCQGRRSKRQIILTIEK